MKHRVAWILSLLLLICTGAIGIYNGITERSTTLREAPLPTVMPAAIRFRSWHNRLHST
jgi:hypothetical protein